MTQVVCIIDDPFDPESRAVYECDDIRDLLEYHYNGSAPEGLEIYHLQVADNCVVTPQDEADWSALPFLPGPFYVVVAPAGLDPGHTSNHYCGAYCRPVHWC
jgi:hypothetical protein